MPELDPDMCGTLASHTSLRRVWLTRLEALAPQVEFEVQEGMQQQ